MKKKPFLFLLFIFANFTSVLADSLYSVKPISLEDSSTSKEFSFSFYEQSNSTRKYPTIFIGEIMQGDYRLSTYFASYFAKKGFQVVLVRSPEFSQAIETVHRYRDLDRLKSATLGTLRKYQLAFNWIRTNPSIDPAQIHIFGVSFGGILTPQLMENEKINKGFFALSGTDLAGILTYSLDPSIENMRKRIAKNEFSKTVDTRYFQTLLLEHLNQLRLPEIVSLKTIRTQVVFAENDRVIPSRYNDLLWRQLGKPKRIKVPNRGHYGAILSAPQLGDFAIEWYRSKG